ncbi:MAG: hypothetical protein FJ405_16135, partial [Verrucomicrobia bacterium]|nr:hypothetical protein [Verrucomicrobiota bacterium]
MCLARLTVMCCFFVSSRWVPVVLVVAIMLASRLLQAAVVINEIHYHPVEIEAFDDSGRPVLDLSEDVHEFLELHNPTNTDASLSNWSLSGGVSFDFPPGTILPARGFLVVARNPRRLEMIPSYGLSLNQVLGPYRGVLANSGDTVRLIDSSGKLVDAVTYSASSPWAVGADALGADDEWTGARSADHQYRGRSLERVRVDHPSADPANWIASPLSKGPTPGGTNSSASSWVRPVVMAFSAVQTNGADALTRSNQPVRVAALFSSAHLLSNISVEWFVDNVNLTNEPLNELLMAADPTQPGSYFSAVIPGQVNRAVVRYRIKADRGVGVEVVSPRADDPFQWHAFFVSPTRVGANPAYDVFIRGSALTQLEVNISQSPRRVTLPDPPGIPRASWNADEAAIFVHEGRVYDIRMRYHGSRYNRNAGRQSYKFRFPRYAPLNGRTSYFETDKGDEHRLGWLPYHAADLPVFRCRSVDLYLNANAALVRLEQEEMDTDLYERWIREQEAKYPDRRKERRGWFYKSSGVVPLESALGIGQASSYTTSGEGPYYIGNCAPIPPKQGWNLRQRYDWTFPIQMDSWRGGGDVHDLVTGLWSARGDLPTAPNPRLPSLKDYLLANFDIDATLTYIAIRNWSAPFDNATHNHFLWKKGDGRWGMAAWDLDAEFSNSGQSIFWDEWEPVQPDSLRGPQWIKDSFLKTFRDEFRRKIYILTHTLLTPSNMVAMGAGAHASFAASRTPVVVAQSGLGPWHAPVKPQPLAPANGAGVVPPALLVASAYSHTRPSNPEPHVSSIWTIRRSDGGYTNPVFRLHTTSNLTSLPVPFDELVFGETYFWKVSYLDRNGHPSRDSDESSFNYGPERVTVPLITISPESLWRYEVSGTPQPADWTGFGFDDSGWKQGAALIADETGRLPELIRTTFAR